MIVVDYKTEIEQVGFFSVKKMVLVGVRVIPPYPSETIGYIAEGGNATSLAGSWVTD